MEETVELDKALYLEFQEARRNSLWWAKEQSRLAQMIRKQAGDATKLTVDAKPVLTYGWINAFREEAFKKECSELYEQYVIPTVTYEINWTRLAVDHPDVLSQYRQRRLEIVK